MMSERFDLNSSTNSDINALKGILTTDTNNLADLDKRIRTLETMLNILKDSNGKSSLKVTIDGTYDLDLLMNSDECPEIADLKSDLTVIIGIIYENSMKSLKDLHDKYAELKKFINHNYPN